MPAKVNNAFYDDLGREWVEREDHPIALLRRENALRIPWIMGELSPLSKALDIGCGAGFLCNALIKEGHEVVGLDASSSSLSIARKEDETKKVHYLEGLGESLPFPNESFDAAFALDLLEHVESPEAVIIEAGRVLKPGGRFFFHTFNRSLLSYLLIIKGVEWFVPHAPLDMHLYSHFIRPKELVSMLKKGGLILEKIEGFVPKILSKGTLDLLFKRKVTERFSFRFSKSLQTGYCGIARKAEDL